MIASYSWNVHGKTLTNYTTYYKTYTPRKKITMEDSSKELPFLDILIKNVNGQIITEISHKLTDTHQYLHFKSHHPKNCIKSIPYTLAYRIHTIITDKKLKKILPQKLHTTLYLRGYPTTLINKRFDLAEKYHKDN